MIFKEDFVFVTGGNSNYRIPSIVVDKRGTVHAFCSDRRGTVRDDASEMVIVYARKKLGEDWEPIRELAYIPGWAINIGSAVYDEETDTVMCNGLRVPKMKNEFVDFTEEELLETERREKEVGVSRGQFWVYSTDGGDTWQDRPMDLEKVEIEHIDGRKVLLGGFPHGSGSGIQLRFGEHKGRLLCPSRTEVGQYYDVYGLQTLCYNNSIYSDDHGVTWKASAPVQVGTGEGTLCENADGTIAYNSRAYFYNERRYLATSTDGGETYGDFRIDEFLRETHGGGCNAALFRIDKADLKDTSILPEGSEGVTLFSNPRSSTRDHMTVCVSFDGGKTWPKTKLIYEGCTAYSSLAFSKADQCVYLLYEMGKESPYEGLSVAAFDLEWLLATS